MAQSLNPSKTLDLNLLRLSNSPSGSPLPVKSISKLLKKKKIPSIMVYASSKMSSTQHQTPLSLSLQALTDGDRKTEVMNIIKNSVSNCLSETHLDLTVPGLKSKTRGKVIFFSSSHNFCSRIY